jgi:hypothetical protein
MAREKSLLLKRPEVGGHLADSAATRLMKVTVNMQILGVPWVAYEVEF